MPPADTRRKTSKSIFQILKVVGHMSHYFYAKYKHNRFSAPTNVITGNSDDARRHQVGWQTTNKSASAWNTAVAFYLGVYRGVIYISAGKTVNEGI